MASGPDQPPAGPPRLMGSLARHRWVAAAGMTATIAAVAGGGLALARHDSSPGPPKKCGLVLCAAALPASVQPSADESASAPAALTPTAAQHATTPPGPAHSPTSPAGSAAAPGGTAPGATAPGGTAPGAAGPAVAPPAAAAADQPASAERAAAPGPRGSCTAVIAFTARGTLSTPVRCIFTGAVGQLSQDSTGHPRSGAAQDSDRAGRQLRPGLSRDGWPASWLSGWLSQGQSGGGHSGGGWPGAGWPGAGWPGAGWPGAGWPGAGWPGAGWSGGGWSGGGWSGGGRPGQHGGW